MAVMSMRKFLLNKSQQKWTVSAGNKCVRSVACAGKCTWRLQARIKRFSYRKGGGGYLQTCHLNLIRHQNGAKNRRNAGQLRSYSENTFLQIALSVPIWTRYSANLLGKCVKSYAIAFGNEEYLYRVMPSGTLGFLNVQAISKAVFDKDSTFTIPSYLGR